MTISPRPRRRAGRSLTEEEKREQMQSLKEVSKGVSDFLLEAAKGRGRPFSREDEAHRWESCCGRSVRHTSHRFQNP